MIEITCDRCGKFPQCMTEAKDFGIALNLAGTRLFSHEDEAERTALICVDCQTELDSKIKAEKAMAEARVRRAFAEEIDSGAFKEDAKPKKILSEKSK